MAQVEMTIGSAEGETSALPTVLTLMKSRLGLMCPHVELPDDVPLGIPSLRVKRHVCPFRLGVGERD